MQKYYRQSGYTLIELLIVIILLGILVAGSSNVLTVGFNSFFAEKNIINANWQTSVALERMTRDLRATRSTTDITTATANSITINDLYGNTITYQVTGTQLLRNNQAIADGVSNVIFSYYQADGTLITSLSSASLLNIRYIVITLNMNYNNITFPTITAVYLWNIR